MNKRDRIEALHDAERQLNLAIDNIKVALRGTSHEGYADAYIVGHLTSWLDSDFNMGIAQYIEKLNEEFDFED